MPQFPPRVRRAEPKLFADRSVAQSLDWRLQHCCALPDPDLRVVAALQFIPNIDAGELLLVGALSAIPDSLLLTGDKRELTALAARVNGIPDCRYRFICVEQLLWLGLDRFGPQELVTRVRQWTPRDATARAIIGTSGTKSEAELREGLRSYLRSLDGEAPGLLRRDWGL